MHCSMIVCCGTVNSNCFSSNEKTLFSRAIHLKFLFTKNQFACQALREKISKYGVFLVRIFLYLGWMFFPYSGKYGPVKIPYLNTFQAVKCKSTDQNFQNSAFNFVLTRASSLLRWDEFPSIFFSVFFSKQTMGCVSCARNATCGMSKAENLRQDRRPTAMTEAYFVKIINDIHSLLTIFAKKLHLRCLTGFRIRLLIAGES